MNTIEFVEHPKKTLADWFALFEDHYAFECEGGPLKNCVDWTEFKRMIAAINPEVGNE